MLQAAIESGIKIPYYCYHPGLGIDGSCRVCIVKIEKMPKLQTSCSTPVADGMVVSTQTPDVVEARASVFEFLLINHPLDCPVCDKGGECPLQDFSYSFGPNESRMEFPRRVFDGEGVRADVDFGPTLMLNRNRCILCTRCVRFMREIDADPQINIVDRGYGSEIATFREEGVHSLLSGNLMDVCPVGAITTRDYRFKSRPWDNPEAVDTICTLCEKGCNTTAWIKAKPEWAKGARLMRMTPRLNPDGQRLLDVRHRPLRLPLGRRRRPPAAAAAAQRGRRARAGRLDERARQAGRAGRRSRRPGRPALPALGARLARGAVRGRPARRRVRRAGGGRRGQLAPAREAAAGRREVQDSADRRAQRAGARATSASRSSASPSGEPDLSAFRADVAVRKGRRPVRVRSRPGRLDRRSVVGDRRAAVRCARDADRARRADDATRRTLPTSCCPAPPGSRRTRPTSTSEGRCRRPRAVITPPGEAHEDWQVFVDVGVALGAAVAYASSAEIRARARRGDVRQRRLRRR